MIQKRGWRGWGDNGIDTAAKITPVTLEKKNENREQSVNTMFQ